MSPARNWMQGWCGPRALPPPPPPLQVRFTARVSEIDIFRRGRQPHARPHLRPHPGLALCTPSPPARSPPLLVHALPPAVGLPRAVHHGLRRRLRLPAGARAPAPLQPRSSSLWAGAQGQHRPPPPCARPPPFKRGLGFCVPGFLDSRPARSVELPVPHCTSPQACGPRTLPAYSLAPPHAACRPDHVDIDHDDSDDPMACTPYVNDIFEYLRDSEVRAVPASLPGPARLLLGRAAGDAAAAAAAAAATFGCRRPCLTPPRRAPPLVRVPRSSSGAPPPRTWSRCRATSTP